MWKKTAAVAGLALALAVSLAARSEEPSVGQKVDEAMQRALNLMERFIGAIPGSVSYTHLTLPTTPYV